MITSGFFYSVNGDRKYEAEDLSRYFEKIISSGVFANPSSNLQVFEKEGMVVKVAAGRGWIDSRWIDNDSDYLLTIEQSNMTLPRIDLVILKLNLNESARTITIEVKKGVAAATPVAPVLERTEEIKEYCLAEILIPANSTTLTQSNITDVRPDTNRCGWVTVLIDQVDTATLFEQYKKAYDEYFAQSTTEFEEWFNHLQQTLQVSTLVREKRNVVYSTVQNQTVFNIGIPTYIAGYDILEVYINGLRLLLDVDYLTEGHVVTLTKGLDVNNPVEFVVFTSNGTENAKELADDVDVLKKDVADLKLNKADKEKIVISLTAAAWVADGVEFKQVATSNGVTSDSTLLISSKPNNIDQYAAAGVFAFSQAVNSITFKAKVKPTTTIEVNVVNLGV